MFGNMGEMMKKVQKMQSQMEDAQKKLETVEVEGGSGGGLVKMTANGKGTIKSVKIDPTLLDPQEGEVLEDLLVAAFLDTQSKVEEKAAEEMGKVTGNLKLPAGLKLPF